MKKTKGRGVSRKNIKYCTKSIVQSIDPPPKKASTLTKKQHEVVVLLDKGLNLEEIRRELGLKWKNSVVSSLNGAKNKGFVNHIYGSWSLSKKGKEHVKSCTMGSAREKVISGGFREIQSIHNYRFEVIIESFPKQWSTPHLFLSEDLRIKDYLYSKTSKQWFLYYEECTITIAEGTHKCRFQVLEQQGHSFDEVKSKCWDVFVSFFNIIKSKGFKLERTVTSNNPDFSNPKGFFSMMASYSNQKGFKINSNEGSFWIDYSLGYPEEETDNYNWAKRTEELAKSVMGTEVSFYDIERNKLELGEMKKVMSDLVKLEAMKTIPKQYKGKEDLTEANYFG